MRHDTPSPISPLTPNGSGTYLTQQLRPSSSSGRPPTRDGPKTLKPEIIIEFGSSKTKGKSYPSVSVSTKAYKRSSNGGSSFEDAAFESPGSDASHTIRTGFPEAPLPPQPTMYGRGDGYGMTPTLPSGYQHHHNSSTSSYTSSSRTPSLYVTSDPDHDSPTRNRTARLPPAIHQSNEPSSPGMSRTNKRASTGYNTTLITPHGFSIDSHASDGLHAHDYQADWSASSHASSGASRKARRGMEPERPHRRTDQDRRRQEELEVAEADNIKQVRFELGRAESRANERAETQLAEKEKDRANFREEARRRQDQERQEDARRREDETARARKQKPVITNTSTKRTSGSRRGSMTMTRTERDEQQRLLAAEMERMEREQRAAEARERVENAQLLIQAQQDPAYYSTRTGGMSSNTSGLARRDSQSRRGSFSSEVRPTASSLGRTPSNRRASIIQPNPPPINTSVTQGSYQRPPSTRTHQPPPVSFPSGFNAGARPPSARRPSFSSQELPFTRCSAENPFATNTTPVTIVQDPWDARSVRDALPTPSARQSDGRYTIQRRGEDVVSGAARQAARRAAESAFESDSGDDMVTRGAGRRLR
jgi:hypothetical protein